jgi:hypothetical protein
MTQVVLQNVKAERKVSARTNKPYIAVSIQVDEVWHNGFGNEEMMSWSAGDTKELELFDEEYNGKMYKKFKVPNRLDALIARVEELEARMDKLGKPNENTAVETDPDKDDVYPEDDLPF